MMAAIFAGGLGTRIRELEADLPKPLIRLGAMPILLHVMTIYLANGVRDFLILGGYKLDKLIACFDGIPGEKRNSDQKSIAYTGLRLPDWPSFDARIVDTLPETQTGGRLLLARDYLRQERFCLTYGDSLVDFSLRKSLAIHAGSGSWVTMCSYKYRVPYGTVTIRDGRVTGFDEKRVALDISAGFFIVEPKVLDLIPGTDSPFETTALPELARRGLLAANGEVGFWHPMDTPAEHAALTRIYQESKPRLPWLGGAE